MRVLLTALLAVLVLTPAHASVWRCTVAGISDVGAKGLMESQQLGTAADPLLPAVAGDQFVIDEDAGTVSRLSKRFPKGEWTMKFEVWQRSSSQNPAILLYQDRGPASHAARQIRVNSTYVPARLLYVSQYGAVATGLCERQR